MEKIPISGKDSSRCPYCGGGGFEIQLQFHPEVYGPNAPPIEFAVPCRNCNGRKANFDEVKRSRVNLPYDAYLSAFNPSAYLDKDGKIIDFKKQFNIVQKFVEKFPKVQAESDIKGLYFFSKTTGTGKTYLASIVCNELCSRYQIIPVYITENGLLNEIEKIQAPTEYNTREKLKRAQVLFIDDLWRKNTGRDWVADELFEIIDYRYTNGLCTIVTSNVSLEERGIDSRIVGRLNAMCAIIHLPEVEMRKRNKPDEKKKFIDILNEED